MLVTVFATAVLVSLCIFLHLAVMSRLQVHAYRDRPTVKHPVLVVLFILFAAHLVEVLIYAIGLYLLDLGGFGRLTGAVVGGEGWFFDHFYFSISAYTTLGIGDIVPRGEIRLVAGVESLTGLLLIAWSASFTYLVMERLWGNHDHGDD